MYTPIDFDTAAAEHALRMRHADQEGHALRLHRARRLQYWADRSARFSGWLAGLARSHRARVG